MFLVKKEEYISLHEKINKKENKFKETMYLNNQAPGFQDQGYMKILLILLFFLLLFHLIGIAGPGWIVVSIGDLRSMTGIWYAVVCAKDNCETVSMVQDNASSGRY